MSGKALDLDTYKISRAVSRKMTAIQEVADEIRQIEKVYSNRVKEFEKISCTNTAEQAFKEQLIAIFSDIIADAQQWLKDSENCIRLGNEAKASLADLSKNKLEKNLLVEQYKEAYPDDIFY